MLMSPFIFLLSFIPFWGLSMSVVPPVKLQVQQNDVVMDNGILQVTISTPGGLVTGIRYNGIENLLEYKNKEDNRGYWDQDWGDPTRQAGLDKIISTNWTVIMQKEEQVELSFTRIWNPSLRGQMAPLNIDKRFVMLRGSSGFYCYGIHERLPGWPGFGMANVRVVFKLSTDRFHYMAIADNRQRYMPSPEDRTEGRGRALDFPEAVLLFNPIEPEFKGEMISINTLTEAKNIGVHGWISTEPAVGFWQITPSGESRSFGPLKQYLTSHVGPTTMTTFHSTHYLGQRYGMTFGDNEPWKKVYGPFFVYVNSVQGRLQKDQTIQRLWGDAKKQLETEVRSWPYNFPASGDFLKSHQRGSITGRLLVQDRHVSGSFIPAKGAYVGLAFPGEPGSWEREAKGYQFWTLADLNGYFLINNVLIGDYNLYAWVPGFIGDYKYENIIKITPGSAAKLDNIIYKPPRDGPTLWEIGIPDRSAFEFYVPEPDPGLINKLYVNHPDRFRQYGLWTRYAELHTKGDLIYTVGVSDYKKDWFYAQNTRKINGTTYQGTTWQIKFKLENVNNKAVYKLRVALAAVNQAELQVRINDPSLQRNPLFSSQLIGADNAIARHGIHGAYWLFHVDVPGATLLNGENTISLTQTRGNSAFVGIMYDYIRFDGPPR